MKKENQKIVFSKELIKNAALKLIKEKSTEKITITKLCKTADISRDTFYKYYSSIYDVYTEIYSNAKEEIVSKIQGIFKSKNLKKDLILYLNYIRENNLLFQTFFIEENIIQNESRKIEKELVASISALFHEDDEFENTINAYFLYKGSLAIITKWINNPNGYSTGELAESLTKIIKKILR